MEQFGWKEIKVSLKYCLNGETYTIPLYDNIAYDWSDYITIYKSSSKKYIPLTSNLNHKQASHLRIHKAGTTYAFLK